MPESPNKPKRIVPVLASAWLLVLVAYGLGVYTVTSETWPWPLIESVQEYIAGDEEEDTTLAEKVKNDAGLKPFRHYIKSKRPFDIPDDYAPLAGLPIRDRRLAPLWYLSDAAPKGFRLLYGTFDFGDGLHGAVLLSPEGEVVNTWTVSQHDAEWAERKDWNIFPHGVELLKDGSLIFAFDGGSSLTSYDYCGDIRWRVKGKFHHAVSRDGEGAIWSWGAPDGSLGSAEYAVKIDAADGTVLKSFHMDSVRLENPEIDIFGIRQDDKPDGSTWQFDRWHINDIEPLPADMADAFPAFEAGDLVMSFRAINLVFVMDPETRKVKWWRQGLTRRQHDPDWNDDGTITVFDNNMHREYSRIFTIHPDSYEAEITVDGADYEFYTWHRGKHQRTPGGGFLVTSSDQGRVFELDAQGEMVFEFVNRYDDEGGQLVMSEARWLPPDYFEELPTCAD